MIRKDTGSCICRRSGNPFSSVANDASDGLRTAVRRIVSSPEGSRSEAGGEGSIEVRDIERLEAAADVASVG
jgi:hypothetical protein